MLASFNTKMSTGLIVSCALIFSGVVQSGIHAAPVAKKPPVAQNTTKGQGQMAGANGEFGTVYSFQDGWNMQILSAQYSVEPRVTYENSGVTAPADGEKLLVVAIAIKNATTADNWVGSIPTISAIDQNQQQYETAATVLTSQGNKGFGGNLKPGQGEGQPELNDPLLVIFRLPNAARITKLIVNNGRLNSSESVLRYYIAGTTTAEAGGPGDPKNSVAPLPNYVRDPSDTSGATALANGVGGKPGAGVVCPTGSFEATCDAFADALSGDMYDGNAPDDGMKFVYATITDKNITKDAHSTWDLSGNATNQLINTDGDTIELKGLDKATSPDKLSDDHKIEPGQSFTFRLVFEVPTAAKLKTLHYAADSGRYYDFDISGS